MKRWRRYEPYLLSGLWHVHTDRTDGLHGVPALVEFAANQRFPLLGIVEHVRRDPSYDFHALREEAVRLATTAGIECAVGCEAKVLDGDGTLDVPDDVLAEADVVYAAFHGTPFTRDEYLAAVHAMLRNPDVDVWAHPFAYAERQGFDLDDEVADLIDTLRANEVLFEVNLARPSPTATAALAAADVPKIVGYDLHDLERWTLPAEG